MKAWKWLKREVMDLIRDLPGLLWRIALFVVAFAVCNSVGSECAPVFGWGCV